MRAWIAAYAVGILVLLQGCAATQTAIAHHDLDVQTKMTNTIFLDPVAPDKRTVFVQAKNTSDRPEFDLETPVKQAIAAKGYRIMEDPSQAYYILQVNVLQVGKNDPSAAEQEFAGGYGSILGGAAAGAALGGLTGSYGGVVAGGILGAAVSTVADSAVKNVTYTIITDVQLSERTKAKVSQVTNQSLAQGSAGTTQIYAAETTNMKRYQTRIMSTANQVNLSLEDALPALTNGMTHSIAGLM